MNAKPELPKKKSLFEKIISGELDNPLTVEMVKNIGSISDAFTKAGFMPYKIYKESLNGSESLSKGIISHI